MPSLRVQVFSDFFACLSLSTWLISWVIIALVPPRAGSLSLYTSFTNRLQRIKSVTDLLHRQFKELRRDKAPVQSFIYLIRKCPTRALFLPTAKSPLRTFRYAGPLLLMGQYLLERLCTGVAALSSWIPSSSFSFADRLCLLLMIS